MSRRHASLIVAGGAAGLILVALLSSEDVDPAECLGADLRAGQLERLVDSGEATEDERLEALRLRRDANACEARLEARGDG